MLNQKIHSCLQFCCVSSSTSQQSPLLLCQQIQSCLHFCRVSRSTSRSPVSTFVVSADPPLALLSPLLLCQQIHLSHSCLHFCYVSRSTSCTPVSTFVVSADHDPPLAVSMFVEVHLLQSCMSVPADPLLAA